MVNKASENDTEPDENKVKKLSDEFDGFLSPDKIMEDDGKNNSSLGLLTL